MALFRQSGSSYSVIEPAVYLALLLFFYVGGYFLVIQVSGTVEERIQQHQIQQLSRVAQLYVISENPQLTRLDPFSSYIDLTIEQLKQEKYLGEQTTVIDNWNSTSILLMYSSDSFVRIIEQDRRYRYEIRLCSAKVPICTMENALVDTTTVDIRN